MSLETLDKIKDLIPLVARKKIKHRLYESMRSLGLRPSVALNGLDRKLDELVDFRSRPGFFVEAGGNDGMTQSNTYHLEKYHGWTGFLIEPVPWLADLSQRFRTCEIERYALGSFDSEGAQVQIWENDLRSSAVRQHGGARPISVALKPLSRMLEERNVSHVDFFSLDVEGFESEVLRGIDFSRHSFGAILVETKNLEGIPLPRELFREPVALTHHDYLFLAAGSFIR